MSTHTELHDVEKNKQQNNWQWIKESLSSMFFFLFRYTDNANGFVMAKKWSNVKLNWTVFVFIDVFNDIVDWFANSDQKFSLLHCTVHITIIMFTAWIRIDNRRRIRIAIASKHSLQLMC